MMSSAIVCGAQPDHPGRGAVWEVCGGDGCGSEGSGHDHMATWPRGHMATCIFTCMRFLLTAKSGFRSPEGCLEYQGCSDISMESRFVLPALASKKIVFGRVVFGRLLSGLSAKMPRARDVPGRCQAKVAARASVASRPKPTVRALSRACACASAARWMLQETHQRVIS